MSQFINNNNNNSYSITSNTYKQDEYHVHNKKEFHSRNSNSNNHHYQQQQPFQQHHVLMEPLICLEPFSNTNELFKRPMISTNHVDSSFVITSSSIYSSSSSITYSIFPSSSSSRLLHVNNNNNNNTYIKNNNKSKQEKGVGGGEHCLTSESNVQNYNNQTNYSSPQSLLQHGEATKHKIACWQISSNEDVFLEGGKCRNGSPDAYGENEARLKRKYVRPISPCKKRRADQLDQHVENCEHQVMVPNSRIVTKHVLSMTSKATCGENGVVLIGGSSPLQTSTSTDEQIMMMMTDASSMNNHHNGTSSVNNHSHCSSSESSIFSHEDEQDDEDEDLEEDQHQHSSNVHASSSSQFKKSNLRFENVEFVTPKRKSNRGRKPKPKKVNVSEGPWTEEEHDLFMLGYQECGKNWSKIADEYVPSRSRTQIASHAQKYFRKQRNKKNKH